MKSYCLFFSCSPHLLPSPPTPLTVAQRPNSGPRRLIVEVSSSHTHTHTHTHTYLAGLLCTSDQPVAEAANYTKNTTDIHDLVEIWIQNPSNGAAADPRLWPHGHQDGPPSMTTVPNYKTVLREVTSCGLLPTLRGNVRKKKKWKQQKFNMNYYRTLRHDFVTRILRAILASHVRA